MAKLKDKIENALNETRILVLGIQILIGFGYRTFFEPGFARMSHANQQLELGALAMMLLGFGLLVIPVAYHRIVMQGRATAEFHRVATATVSAGLLPFALAMAAIFFLAAEWIADTITSASIALALLLLTLSLWYGVELLKRKRRTGGLQWHAIIDPLGGVAMEQEENIGLAERVKQVLIECRVVLPGAQALLGFQLVIIWMDRFETMAQSLKILHLASLLSIAVCTVLLIMPAAYHRIAEQGEDSETLVQITERAVLSAMIFLAAGICCDFYVVSRLTSVGPVVSAGLALVMLIFFLGCWFGYTLWSRHRNTTRRYATSTGQRRAA
jgi:hypothetical protein